MKLALDARWYRTGLGSYTSNLLKSLRGLGNSLHLHGIVSEESAPYMAALCDSMATVRAPRYSLREQWQVPFATGKWDLLHVPHYNAPMLCRKPLVISIHDLIHLSSVGHQGRASVWLYASAMLRMAARRADHLVTVSEYSKRRIIDELGVPESKVTAIPNGVSAEFHGTDKIKTKEFDSPEGSQTNPYFLCVSSLRPHKNLVRLTEAAKLFWERTKNTWNLLIVGDGEAAERNRILLACQKLGIRDRVFLVPVLKNSELPKVYRAAEFLIFPSLMEGFGLPVLEAMASGIPVVCARTSSLPEVGGDAAKYFDPFDPEDMARAMEVVLNGTEARIMRTKGIERAATFTWQRSARLHYEVYCNVLQN